MIAGFRKILIIGIGLIGGSLAAALKERDAKLYIYGQDTDQEAIRLALEQGFIDSAEVPDYKDIDLIVLASPIETFEHLLKQIAENDYKGAITDVASAKLPVASAAKAYLKMPGHFIPGHPMAGREKSGVGAAKSDLFEGAYWVLTPDENTDNHIFRRLHTLITSIGARVISVDVADHDRLIATVSHVPHVAASSLVLLASSHAGENGELLRLAAGGFKDTTRVAAGDPALWSGILLSNADLIADELENFVRIISNFQQSVRNKDENDILAMLREAADARKSIPSKWVAESAELVEIHVLMDNRPGIIADITATAGRMGCNIQAIDIDHQSEIRAILRLVLTDEGETAACAAALEDSVFDVEIV
jgi:prephenate dehydrogenase